MSGELLDGKFIGEQLRYASEVKLIHLGACLTMAGDVPSEIRKASGPRVPPVSGFADAAVWAGSALIDFSYLDLVLARKMPPGEAVREIRESISFAGDRANRSGAIAPVGLKIVE